MTQEVNAVITTTRLDVPSPTTAEELLKMHQESAQRSLRAAIERLEAIQKKCAEEISEAQAEVDYRRDRALMYSQLSVSS